MDLGLSWQSDCPRRGDVGPIPTGDAPEAGPWTVGIWIRIDPSQVGKGKACIIT